MQMAAPYVSHAIYNQKSFKSVNGYTYFNVKVAITIDGIIDMSYTVHRDSVAVT